MLSLAQKTPKKWDVSNPAGWNIKDVSLSTDEGTWMNVDVSPDGKEIVFDMLGDIYIIPVGRWWRESASQWNAF